MRCLQIRTEFQDLGEHGLIDTETGLCLAAFHAEACLKIATRKMTRQHGAYRMFGGFKALRQTQPKVEPLTIDGTHFPDDARFSAFHGMLHGMACKTGHALERHAFHPPQLTPATVRTYSKNQSEAGGEHRLRLHIRKPTKAVVKSYCPALWFVLLPLLFCCSIFFCCSTERHLRTLALCSCSVFENTWPPVPSATK